MKKILLAVALLLPLLSNAQHKSTKTPKTYDLIIGTYTNGTSKGIYVYRFYVDNGRLAYLNQVDDVSNPSYLTVSDNHKFVYAVNEDPKVIGGVSSFTFDAASGKLTPINRQSSEGTDPCYISVDKALKHAFVANYSGGSLTVLPINKDGSLGKPVQNIADEGHGVNPDRQEKPHVHTAVLSPDEKYLLYTDLGTDKLNICRYHPSEAQPLQKINEDAVSVKGGDGPRHLDFSPDHKYLYLVTELGAKIYEYQYKGGKLKEVQSVTMIPDGFTGMVGAADIHVSADGRFLYASNRGDANELVAYSINPENGNLTFLQRISTEGRTPRNFVIDPSGKFLLVANQNSDSVIVYRIDQATGKLMPTGARLQIGNPVCLKFAPAE
jgi:6-phosphogluconolactonase